MELNIGIRAHDLENRPLEELVEEIAGKGLTSVQLALGKSFDYLKLEPGTLSPGLAHYIGTAFARKNVQIAVLGCYFNMIHPDYAERRKGIERFKEHIRFARDFGCSVVGSETGNVNPEIVYTVENFKEEPFLEVVESVRELVKEAEKFGVIVGIEAGVNHPIYCSKVMKRLLDMVNSNHLQVILDPVNLLTIDTYLDQDNIIQEAFDQLGDRIVILHAKDFLVEENQLKTVAVGQGLLNYDVVLKQVKRKKPYLNILMEETTEPFINESLLFLKNRYEQA
ncbi:sugar phosphate isomerase/epimerase family protein [Neobacillus vireti]|uniref:sugar phosphate isomerase/epimerase family protein n=1 Tax=Neobacillus vireti TaxID=220686 RepID=UPI002FFFD456